jgi:nitroreductase
MNVFEAILTRKVPKSFQKKEIDDKLIGLILHSATRVPSAGNLQAWRFIVVKDEDVKKKLSELSYNEKIIEEAPVSIVVCVDFRSAELKYGGRGIGYVMQDVCFASMIILIAAKALGLGGLILRNFKEGVRDILELPNDLKPVFIIPIGYVSEEVEIDRLPYENLTSIDKYGRKYEFKLKPIITYLKEIFEKRKNVKEDVSFDLKGFLKKITK